MDDPLLIQAKQIVINIYAYLEERQKRKDSLAYYKQNITDFDKHIAVITGLSETSIKRIISERKHNQRPTSFQRKTIILDETDLFMIKGIVNGFYEKENEFPSLLNLQTVLCDENILDCGIGGISTLLHHLGFHYKPYESAKVEIEYGDDEHRTPCRAFLRESDSSPSTPKNDENDVKSMKIGTVDL